MLEWGGDRLDYKLDTTIDKHSFRLETVVSADVNAKSDYRLNWAEPCDRMRTTNNVKLPANVTGGTRNCT